MAKLVMKKKTAEDSYDQEAPDTGKQDAKRLAKEEALLKKRAAELDKDQEKLDNEKEKLGIREKAVRDAELKREKGYTDERKKLDDEIFERRQKLEKELADQRTKALDNIDQQLQDERKKRQEQLVKEIDAKRAEAEIEIKKERENIEKQKAVLNEQAQKYNNLVMREMEFKASQEEIERYRSEIDNRVKEMAAEKEKSFEKEKSRLEAECEKLRDSITSTEKVLDLYEDIKRKLGGDPERAMTRLKAFEEMFANRERELMEKPVKEMQIAIDSAKKEKEALEQACIRLSEKNVALSSIAHNSAIDQQKITELEDENRRLTNHNTTLDADVNRLTGEIERMVNSYERKKDRDGRIKDIEEPPYFPEYKARALIAKKDKWFYLVDENKKEFSEIQWLDSILQKCSDYGLKFPRRILYAYHTSLKTAEWSILTVLAGVSGTGKSELPKWYAHFGGLNFLSVSVQPNWDSQESMLGFFNPIDNRFDAKPVLRLLAQSQKKTPEEIKAKIKEMESSQHSQEEKQKRIEELNIQLSYPCPLSDVMTLILLDEMNLAHVELYFAEFLSKLESRRGTSIDKIEFIDVPLGSGIPSYKLELGRNVLWTGTMNQDETTKSLSDKVLDRGIIIQFPRPKKLERRQKLIPLDNPAPLLPRVVWQSWRKLDSPFTDEQIKDYKERIEKINLSLERVSRGFGHRVWQSIESYMANYPTIIKALADQDGNALKKNMDEAFEDQLAQKVMPKLRGIETQGKSSDCLKEIRSQLDIYPIVDDFDKSCKSEYGQFNWNSNNYLLKEDIPPSEQA